MFGTKKARSDIHTAGAFLCTHVRAPYEDERKKLVLIMRYLFVVTKVLLTLSTDRTNIFEWWLDRSHGVHTNCM